MPERAESVKLQIQIPKTLRDNLEQRAKETGVTLNQYLMFLMVKAVDGTSQESK
ncbi:MAG: toxin-antitoxin system HicB family antitoxin [Sulfurimonadaceae bacterium]|nr:toxin-antitoxin system HicB family antitoxin [Sulfurimonadaceae bacterium]